MIEVQIRAAQSMVRTELLVVREFCGEAESFFKHKLKRFERSVLEAPPAPQNDTDDMHLSDLRLELEERIELTGYFGVIMVFSTLERFFHHIYQSTMNLAVRPELAGVVSSLSDKWIALGEFRAFLKRMGVDDSGPRFDWDGIRKLHQLRNAIVHQGGMVTEANINSLSPYGYTEEFQRVTVPMSYVQETVRLVEETTKEIGDAYLSALRKKKLLS